MKVLTLFAHFTDEQYKTLSEKYPSEQSLKIFLSGKLSEEIFIEVEQIKNDRIINELSKELKL